MSISFGLRLPAARKSTGALSRFIKVAAFAISTLAVTGCAGRVSSNSYGLDADSAALIREACSDVMRLPRDGAEFQACGGSLAESLGILQDARLTAQADRWCEQQGLTQGTAELAKCVLAFRRTKGSSATADGGSPAAADTARRQSYLSLSHSQQQERAELSCAQLGLHPASMGFRHCVLNLKQAIVDLRSPFYQ